MFDKEIIWSYDRSKPLYKEELIAMLDALEPMTKIDILYVGEDGSRFLKLMSVNVNADVDDPHNFDHGELVLVDINGRYGRC